MYLWQWDLIICNSTDKTGDHYVEWNQPGTERRVPCVLTHAWNITKLVPLSLVVWWVPRARERMEPERWRLAGEYKVGSVRELWVLKHSAFSHITKDSECFHQKDIKCWRGQIRIPEHNPGVMRSEMAHSLGYGAWTCLRAERNKRPLHSVISTLPASHTPSPKIMIYIWSNLKKKGKLRNFARHLLNTIILKINYLTIITLERPRIQALVLPRCLTVTFRHLCLSSWCFDICVSWVWQIPKSSLSSQHTQGPHGWAGLSFDGVYHGNQQARDSLLHPELLSRTNTRLSELQIPGSGVPPCEPVHSEVVCLSDGTRGNSKCPVVTHPRDLDHLF